LPRTKLAGIRYQRGETQRDVADAVGVTQATVFLWETCRTRPRPAAARRLSDHFARPIAELLEKETADPKARRGTPPLSSESA
jgi:transcriptional regulator with XRE-family HTH domain